MNQLPLWAQYLQLSATIALAVVAASITGIFAYRQWRLAHDKLRLDLFDRRFELYSEINDGFLDALFRDDGTAPDSIRRVRVARQKARFLFDASVGQWVDETLESLVKLALNRQRIGQRLTEDQRNSISAEILELSVILETKVGAFHEVLYPFMALDHRQAMSFSTRVRYRFGRSKRIF